MNIVNDLPSLLLLPNPAIRQLIQHRIANIASDEPYDASLHGYFLVLEDGDTLEAISRQLSFDILTNIWTGLRWDHPDYTPAFEFIEEHHSCYEALVVRDDSGFAVSIWISKTIDIPDLVAICQRFAVPGASI